MNAVFNSLIAQATRLTKGGDLQAATAAIQSALRGNASSPDGHNQASFLNGDVIDVGARELGDEETVRRVPEAATQPAQQPHVNGLREQFLTGSFTNVAGTRAYKLYVPPHACSASDSLPLVVMLHGCTQNPDDFALGTGMNQLARNSGFYVLYPAQTQHANSSGCWNWFKHNHQTRGKGEPHLLSGMALDIMERYAIDRRRVYVAGLSAGGAMAAILGETYPDVFAAVGVHSGLPTGAATDLPGALSVMRSGAKPAMRKKACPPTIVFHGDKDSTVNSKNGEQVLAASAYGTQAECHPACNDNGREFTRRVYKDVSGQTVAEHWAVHGAGHAWSGGSARGSYTDSKGPNASKEMLRFFLLKLLPLSQ